MSFNNNSISYVEFPMSKLGETKSFYAQVFGWKFTDWGPDYISFTGAGLDGGFQGDGMVAAEANAGVLVVLFASDIEQTLAKVTKAGGEIVKPIFDFPGGRRFHFLDPNGNELAVWSE